MATRDDKSSRCLYSTNPKYLRQTESSDSLDPLKVLCNPGESVGVARLAASRGDKAGDANLSPLVPSLSLSHVQGATTVAIAHSLSSRCVDAHDPAVDDVAVVVSAGGLGDHWEVLHHIEVRCDSSSIVSILSPTNWGRQLANIFLICIGRRWETGGPDVFAEGDLLRQVDKSNVSIEAVRIPIRVGLTLERGDLHPVRLGAGAHVVGSSHDIKVSSTISAVSCCHHPLVRNEGTSAEPGIVHE